MKPAIQFDAVRLEMGGRSVLDGVSLSIGEGEFIGLLGANGAGKTTLLRAILGLVRPSAGTITVLGATQAKRGHDAIGYMPQSRSLPAHARISVLDFVGSALHAERWGLPRSGRGDAEEIERVLSLVDGADLAKRPIAELSGGQRQRLLIAQALLGTPKILLLDEPLMNLDPHHQEAVVELVSRLAQELGLTVLFSAHEVNPLLSAMDRVLYLGSGAAAIGTVEEVIRPDILSRLYGTPIDVISVQGRIFVMAGGHDLENSAHGHHHEHNHHGHHHHHHQ